MSIIVATAVLQNITLEMNDWFPEEWFENQDDDCEECELHSNKENNMTG